LYYGEIRNREVVEFSEVLRNEVKQLAKSMHEVFESLQLPKAEKQPHCKSCSLRDICMPKVSEEQLASDYLKENLYEETT